MSLKKKIIINPILYFIITVTAGGLLLFAFAFLFSFLSMKSSSPADLVGVSSYACIFFAFFFTFILSKFCAGFVDGMNNAGDKVRCALISLGIFLFAYTVVSIFTGGFSNLTGTGLSVAFALLGGFFSFLLFGRQKRIRAGKRLTMRKR